LKAKASTGHPKLDATLQGGFFEGSAIVLSAPASGQVPILVKNFLKAENQASLLVSPSVSAAAAVTALGLDLRSLICSDKPVTPSMNLIQGKGIENLTEMNLRISETLESLHPKRVALEILSDILLRYKALQTRRWLSEFLERLRAKQITTLAVLDPYMHAKEEVEAVVDLFDGRLDLVERDADGHQAHYLQVKWMHGIDLSGSEYVPTDLTSPLLAASQTSPGSSTEQVPAKRVDMGELDSKLNTIMSRLELIERVLAGSLDRPELATTVSSLRAGVLLVKEPINALERLSSATKYIHRQSVEKDEISRLIIQTLALNGPRNTSQIERAVRDARGTASRRIIRSRIEKLEKEGIVRLTEGHGAVYELVE
jgi:hypothetical protein